MARTFAWQALAIDGVAQAAALAALTGPQDWIEAARAELAEMRPRAIEAANATRLLRAELPEAAAFVWAAIDGDEDDCQRAPRRATTASRRCPGRHFARGYAAPAHPVRRPPDGARGAACTSRPKRVKYPQIAEIYVSCRRVAVGPTH